MYFKKGLFILSLLLVTANVFATEIEVDDSEWKKGKDRSVYSGKPIVSVSGDKLCIYFHESINDVQFVLSDENENVIYNETVPVQGGGSFMIPVGLEANETYYFKILHPDYGYIYGYCIY